MKLQNNNYQTYDKVSFTAMKKSQFSGIDFSVVEKFKAPIEKFDTIEDFQHWAKSKYKELADTDFKGKSDVVANQRHRMKKEWNYMLTDGDKFTPAEQLLIFNGITKELKPFDNTYMPAYNYRVLKKTMNDVNERLAGNRKELFDFGKMYRTNIRQHYQNDFDENYTGWIVIPSRINDRENFDKNVRKLQAISGVHWCTKSTHAKPYLAGGDFHMYIEKGEPKIGLRFDEDVVVEFQGESNNDRLLPEYFNVLEKYAADNELQFVDKAKQEYELSEKNRNLMKDIQENIGDAIKEKDYEKILNYMKISTKKDENGMTVLSHYQIPKGFDYAAIGIKEEDILKTVSKIEGNADFTRSKIQSFGNIKYIGGNANFSTLTLNNLGNIEEIGGNADFSFSNIKDISKLTKIGKNLIAEYAEINECNPLLKIGGEIKAVNSKLPSYIN